jgi:predicted RNA binding protein YcfA (HicA-like mRNA interferase family)
MPVIKVREAIRLLVADGWFLVRQSISYRIFRPPTKPGSVTIAGHLGNDIPPGTWANIRRQAGI